jgi:hypothetical protein
MLALQFGLAVRRSSLSDQVFRASRQAGRI